MNYAAISRHLFLFTLLISCISLGASAQKCVDQADPITGERTVEFKNNQETLRYKYEGGEEVEVYMTFIYADEQNTTMPEGSEVAIKLKDDTVVMLKSAREAMPKTKVTANQYGATVTTSYTLEFVIDKATTTTLASDKISFIRYPALDGGTIDLDIKGLGKIYAGKITKGAECISSKF